MNKEQTQSKKETSRPPTIYDVAQEAGVSAATVSRVLNHYSLVRRETSEKVIAAVKKLGFVRNESKSIPQMVSSLNAQPGELRPHIFVLSMPRPVSALSHSLMEGAQTAAARAGHHLLMNTTPVNEHNSDFFITTLKDHGIAGILVTESISEAALLKVNRHLPMVQCGEYNASVEQLSFVSVDDLLVCTMAVNLLLEGGAKKILYLTTPEVTQTLSRRGQGFRQAMAASGQTYDPSLVHTLPDADTAYIAGQMSDILARTTPDAVLTSNDVLAVSALQSAARKGMDVPRELQILSLEDGPLAAQYAPAVSAVKNPYYAVGFHAFGQLLEEFRHPFSEKKHLLLKPELIRRETTM